MTKPSSATPFPSGSRDTAALERALRIADLRFAGVVEIAADAVISVDAAQCIVYFNVGAAEIFGFTPAEVLGEPLSLLLPVRFRAAHAGHVIQFGEASERARRMGHRRTISALRKNGEEFPAEASISKFRGEDGALVYNVVLRDVSERKRIENAQRFLAEAGELLGSTLDAEITLRHAARIAVPILGTLCTVDVREAGRLRNAAVAHDDERLERRAAQRRGCAPEIESEHPAAVALREGRSVRAEDADGAALFCEDRAAAADHGLPPSDGGWSALFLPLTARGASVGVVGIYRQDTRTFDRDDVVLAEDYARRIGVALDNARLYEEAKRAVRARDDTVAVVSHDLRNPVNAIRMLVGNLVRSATPPDPRALAESLEIIGEAASQADALIEDLLDITRLEAGRLPLRRAMEPVRALVQPALEMLAPLAAQRAIALVVDYAADAPDAWADAARIHQVVSNLVGNALKFTPAGGRVEVTAARSTRGALEIRVADRGIGIRHEHQPHVFDRFYQAGRIDRDGAGLGLPIAKGIVDAHGGRVRVESEPGVGSTFVVTLPTTRGADD